ncbi:MAG: hypothetical protein KF784_13310 [Fimbriimonadaceae bacterium]|nr:hypothetical protein [Fimbriimonadaceae bacterium]
MNAPPGLLITIDWLDSHDWIPYDLQGGVLEIAPNGHQGFSITVQSSGAGFDVTCQGWKMYSGVQHDQVSQLVAWLVSSKARLQIDLVVGSPVCYTLQTFDGSKWLNSKEVKKVNLGFWKQKTTQFFTNGYV